MRGRLLLTKWGLILASGAAIAQPPTFPQAPLPPNYPGPVAPTFPPTQPAGQQLPAQYPPVQYPPSQPQGLLPPGQLPQMGQGTPVMQPPGFPAGTLNQQNPIAQSLEIPLPQKEAKFAINASDVSVRRQTGSWQLWAGQKMLRDFGDSRSSESDAQDAARVMRDLRPTEWAVIGGKKPIVEYGLVNGRSPMTPGLPGSGAEDRNNGVFQSGGSYNGPAVTGAGAKAIVPIDLKTVRVEAVRGVWCLRDEFNIHFNFGTNKTDADQALAVVQRYGFNRVGIVGAPAPVMRYLFASADTVPSAGPFAKAQLQAQVDGLARVGIPVGGVGYVGEMIPIDPRKLEIRKDGGEWVVASGAEVIGRYGQTEWVARDAARTMQDSRFTEFCKLGSAGITFFLVNGKAPTHVPYAVQGRRFDLNALKVQKIGEKWAVTENSRHLLDCANQEEGETLLRVIKHYQFDQLCHLGPTPKLGVSFFARAK